MKKYTALPTITCIIGIIRTVFCENGVIVDTKYGSVMGRRLYADYGLQNVVTPVIDEFLGVPFAAPPVGELRWKQPKEPDRWRGIRNATIHGACCPQPLYHRTCESKHQDEDCLYLNVYSPFQSQDPHRRYPVMVFIHGGSFVGGSGNRFNGSALAQYGVVLVAINYRVFALGFMSTGDDTLEGNYGLYDQILALKWVKDNIANFRGNPSAVTLFGNSAGAASVGFLMMSPQASGLFHRVISHSGVPTCKWSFNQNPATKLREQIADIARGLGCTHTSLSDRVSCMRKLPWKKFTEGEIKKVIKYREETIFFPVIDGRLIPTSPEDIPWKYPFKAVPYIIGLCAKEYAFLGSKVTKEMKEELKEKYHNDKVLRAVRFEYTDWSNVTSSPTSRAFSWDPEIFDGSEILSDRYMIVPSLEYARLLKLYGYSDTYIYVFDNETVYHSADLNYVFGVPFVRQDMDERKYCCDFRKKDEQLSQIMMKMWANFARDGIPKSKGTNKPDIKWIATDPVKLDYLYISTNMTEMRQRFKADKYAFWNVFIPDLISDNRVCNSFDKRSWAFAVTSGVLIVIILVLSFLLLRERNILKINNHRNTPTNQTLLLSKETYNKPKAISK